MQPLGYGIFSPAIRTIMIKREADQMYIFFACRHKKAAIYFTGKTGLFLLIIHW